MGVCTPKLKEDFEIIRKHLNQQLERLKADRPNIQVWQQNQLEEHISYVEATLRILDVEEKCFLRSPEKR